MQGSVFTGCRSYVQVGPFPTSLHCVVSSYQLSCQASGDSHLPHSLFQHKSPPLNSLLICPVIEKVACEKQILQVTHLVLEEMVACRQ